MKWYFIALIGYLVFIFIYTIITYLKTASRHRLSDIPSIIIVFFIFFFAWPFASIFGLYLLVYFSGTDSYKTTTIKPLTEENKATLMNLGFVEGTYTSRNNIQYKGFRKGFDNDGLIVVQYDGRAFSRYGFSETKDQKYIFKLIKKLPNISREEKNQAEIKREIDWAKKDEEQAKKRKKEAQEKLKQFNESDKKDGN